MRKDLRRISLAFLFFALLFGVFDIRGIRADRATIRHQQASSPHRYRIILRVTRPRWRTQPTLGEISKPNYQAVFGQPVKVKNLDSDTEVLKQLNQLNPALRFDRIIAKKSFFLSSDKIWQQPNGFSMHTLEFAIIDQDVDLMNRACRFKGKVVLFHPDNQHSGQSGSTIGNLPDYRTVFTLKRMQELKGSNRLLIFNKYELFYQNSNGKRSYLSGCGPRIISEGSTICLTYDLFIQNRPPQPPSLAATDVVLLTIIKKK